MHSNTRHVRSKVSVWAPKSTRSIWLSFYWGRSAHTCWFCSYRDASSVLIRVMWLPEETTMFLNGYDNENKENLREQLQLSRVLMIRHVTRHWDYLSSWCSLVDGGAISRPHLWLFFTKSGEITALTTHARHLEEVLQTDIEKRQMPG